MASKNLLAGLLVIPGILLASSCYLTSSFDGLTGDPDGGTTSSSSAGGGMGGGVFATPATGILDDFNRLDGDPGSSWALTGAGKYVISSERLVTIGTNPDAAIWAQTFGPRQEVYVTIDSMDGNETEIELLLRNQGAPSECESVVVSFDLFDGSPAVHVAYCTGGQWFLVGEKIPYVLVEGDTIWARGYEDGRIEAYVNGKLLGTWDASAAPMGTSGGRIGVFTYGIPDEVRFDDFGGGAF